MPRLSWRSGSQERSSSLTLPDAVTRPPVDAIRRTYQDLWGSSGRCDLVQEAPLPTTTLQPITSAEVRRRINQLKPRGAPGEDGVRRENLVALEGGPNLLAGLFNCLLWTGYYPMAWEKNVTSMISKEGKDLSSPSGWRPITLASVLARLFSGVMRRSLESIRAGARPMQHMRPHVAPAGSWRRRFTKLLSEKNTFDLAALSFIKLKYGCQFAKSLTWRACKPNITSFRAE